MNQRRTFKCWKCSRTYTRSLDITTLQTRMVACPYCETEGVVDLEPFSKKIKQVLKGTEQEQDLGEKLDLPDVLPTRKPE
jgi:DNA-directed RNA polymerase subunit RPC12/RpoP